MSTIDLFGLTMAFYGAMPPPRPQRPDRNGATWAAAVVFGGVCLATMGPMITIWSFHRPYAEAKARCIESGGRVLYAALDGSGPYRCERPAGSGTAHPSKPVD